MAPGRSGLEVSEAGGGNCRAGEDLAVLDFRKWRRGHWKASGDKNLRAVKSACVVAPKTLQSRSPCISDRWRHCGFRTVTPRTRIPRDFVPKRMDVRALSPNPIHASHELRNRTMADKAEGPPKRPSITDQEALQFHSRGRPGKLEIVPTKPMAT